MPRMRKSRRPIEISKTLTYSTTDLAIFQDAINRYVTAVGHFDLYFDDDDSSFDGPLYSFNDPLYSFNDPLYSFDDPLALFANGECKVSTAPRNPRRDIKKAAVRSFFLGHKSLVANGKFDPLISSVPNLRPDTMEAAEESTGDAPWGGPLPPLKQEGRLIMTTYPPSIEILSASHKTQLSHLRTTKDPPFDTQKRLPTPIPPGNPLFISHQLPPDLQSGLSSFSLLAVLGSFRNGLPTPEAPPTPIYPATATTTSILCETS